MRLDEAHHNSEMSFLCVARHRWSARGEQQEGASLQSALEWSSMSTALTCKATIYSHLLPVELEVCYVTLPPEIFTRILKKVMDFSEGRAGSMLPHPHENIGGSAGKNGVYSGLGTARHLTNFGLTKRQTSILRLVNLMNLLDYIRASPRRLAKGTRKSIVTFGVNFVPCRLVRTLASVMTWGEHFFLTAYIDR